MSLGESLLWALSIFLLLRLVVNHPPIKAALVAALVARAARHIHQKRTDLFNRGYCHGAAMLLSGRPVEEIEAQYSHRFDHGPFEHGMQTAHKDYDALVKAERIRGPACDCRRLVPPAVCDTCETREQFEARTQGQRQGSGDNEHAQD